MNKYQSILILIAFFIFNIGCSSETKEITKDPEPETQTPPVTYNYNHDPNKTEELRVREGLPNFFKKLKNGEEVKVGFIGGSITNGGTWRDKTIEWLKSEYPQANITQINAAIGGKGPDYGACRIHDHLLVHNPDIVFIEFRVNNGGAFKGRALEGMIPQIWKHNPNTEICLVYTIAKWMKEDIAAGNQTSAGKYMEPVANHYGLTSIEFGIEVMKLLNEDKLVFQKGDSPDAGKILFTKDGVHPLDAGHEIYATVLTRSLKAIADHGTPGPNAIPEALYEDCFSNASLVPVNNATFSANWSAADLGETAAMNDDLTDRNDNVKSLFGTGMHTTKQGESYTLNWNGILLGITSTTANKGDIIIEVTTDNLPAKQYDLGKDGAEIAGGYTFLDEVAAGQHTTTIKLIKLADGIDFIEGQFLLVGKPEN